MPTEELSNIQFEREGSREHELSYQQVRDFIRAAGELADKGVMPRERALYLSIATAAQFELMLRQGDIIGSGARKAPNSPRESSSCMSTTRPGRASSPGRRSRAGAGAPGRRSQNIAQPSNSS